MKPRLGYSNEAVIANNKVKGRSTSGQFTQLGSDQVRELKDAFTLLDKDGDGTVSASDVEEMLISLGQEATKDEIEEMLETMPKPLTFSAFLTGMSGHLCDLSSRQELQAAFEAFEDDKKAKGIKVDDLKHQLVEYGMTEEEVNEAIGPFVKSHGFLGDRFNYKDFIEIMRGAEADGEDED